MGAGRQFVRFAKAASLAAATLPAVAGCRDEPTRAVTPFAVEASLSSGPGIVAGSVLNPPPTFVVLNVDGVPLANVPVSIAISAGGGTLRNQPSRTASGPTPIGEWTLDTIAGVNQVTIVAGSAPAVRVSVNGIAGPVSRITSSGELDAPAGDVVGGLALRVMDRYGNAVPRVAVSLEVGEGGGSVSPAQGMTDGSGILAGISWRLGRLGGPQRLLVTAGSVRAGISATIRSSFTPSVRFYGPEPAAYVRTAFTWAADRVRAMVVGDIADIPVLNFDLSRCGVQGASLAETVDDVIVFATVTPIDGAGRVLASAGPCVQRTQSRLPLIGVMRFDADDIEALASNGRLAPVVLHEMLHAIGFGSLWRDLIAGTGTQDPRFTGPLAAAECMAAGGAGICADGRVPLENTGGSGTAEVHWRESVFDAEVMTGFVEPTPDMPLSAMTILSLADLGYVVNRLSSDPYVVAVVGKAAPRLLPPVIQPWESVLSPLFEVTPAGRIRPLHLR